MQPKVLIISHNILSMSSSMGRTIAGFFKNIHSDNLAQLYFHSEVPTTDICTNYYRITDFELIKKRNKHIGTHFEKKDINTNLESSRIDIGNEAKIYEYSKRKAPYMYIVRNLLWSTKKWRNEKLLKWIDDFNPDIIFFASGDYVFSYSVAMEIAKIKNIPILTYICDDYYFAKRSSLSPLYHINRAWHKKTVRRLFKNHKDIVAICDKITNDYQQQFGVKSNTIMTVSSLSTFEKKENDNIKISYIGNMGYDRHLPLIEIGNTLNDLTNGKTVLDIYSAETRPEILKQLSKDNGIRFHGSIPYDKVIQVMEDSDILVHVEDMKDVNREKVRYSVSTKIADSLSCGRCLFAYGPHDVASIEYLKNNNCACVVTDKTQLKGTLEKLLTDSTLREQYIKNGVKISRKKHNIIENCDKFRKILIEAVSNEGNAD